MTVPVKVPRLLIHGVGKTFGATRAVQDVDLTVQAGEVMALVGENGAGKSTLMKILAGSLRADTGTIQLDGEPFHPGNPQVARRAGVAMIYQELSLAPHLTVEENIFLGREPTRWGLIREKEIRRRTREILRFFEHPDIRFDVPVGRLPMAGQQLVEITRALTGECRILILDEPTSSLNRQDTQKLFELIRLLKIRGLAIIYISHFIEEVQKIADRVTILRDGRTVGTYPINEITSSQIVSLMIGRDLRELYPRSPRQAGEVLLEVNALAGKRRPLAASFELHRGEVLGIAGLVGAGRTELLRILMGLAPLRQGSIRFGIYAGPASPLRRWKQGMGFLSEDRKSEGLTLSRSIADNITLTRLRGLGPLGLIWPWRQEQRAGYWMERLGIRARHPRQPVQELSGGNQQKVALARLLYHDCDVLLLDEPTRGVDVAAKASIYQFIDDQVRANEEGKPAKAILMVSGYLPELLGICDRIAVMHRGTLRPPQAVRDLTEHDLMLQAIGQEV
jgi:ribose transport system ATP-binding protein